MLTHPSWGAVERLHHGFLDRRECAGADDWSGVVARVAGVALPVAVPRQVHGARVVVADHACDRPEADGLVVGPSGRLVGVVTADCVPVLLLDPARRLAAAVHAGWRGVVAGVLGAALERLGGLPHALEAAIGPAVGGCCYEVGPEVRRALTAASGDVTAPAWRAGTPRERLDLREAVRLLLAAAGVSRAVVLGPCTICDDRYCSYRRDGAAAGRQLSFVGWA